MTQKLARLSGSGAWWKQSSYTSSRSPKLYGCKEAATSDIILPRHGEHTLVAFGDASGGRYATDMRYRLVGTAAIVMAFPGAA